MPFSAGGLPMRLALRRLRRYPALSNGVRGGEGKQMSSAGWGGPGTGPDGAHGGPPRDPHQQPEWQQRTPPPNGAPQSSQPGQYGQPGSPGEPSPFGAPSPGSWQSPAAQSAAPGMAPPGPPGYGNQQGPGYGGPQGPNGPQGPGYGGPQGPGFGGPQPPPRKRPWALITVALGCVLAMVLVVGGGLTYLVLSQGSDEPPIASDTPSSSASEPSETSASETPSEGAETTPEPGETSAFEVIPPYDVPPGDAEDMWKVMETNPLTEGTLPTLPTCDLPATPVAPDNTQLQAVLDAASGCLNQLWATASSDRGLPWVSPKVVVYTWPDIPPESSCDSSFEEDFPRMCNLDSTIYWPVGYGTALDFTDEANVPGAYMWDLAFIYMNTATWNSSVAIYYGNLRTLLEDSDQARAEEAWRRYSLQMQCLASAASVQVPDGAAPTPALQESLADPANWTEGEPPQNISPEARARWIGKGFDSGGDLSVCNTWPVDADQVT